MLTPEFVVQVLDAIAKFGTGIVFNMLNQIGLLGCFIEQILNGNIQLF